MTFQTATSAAPQPFAAHMDAPMPRGLREEADAMSFEAFLDEYASSTGPLRLGQWLCTDAERPATRLGPQARNYQATLAVGDRISTSSAAASGPVAALTAMLYERGIAVEMTAFTSCRPVSTPRRSSAAATAPGLNGRWAGGRPDAVGAARGHRLREPAG